MTIIAYFVYIAAAVAILSFAMRGDIIQSLVDGFVGLLIMGVLNEGIERLKKAGGEQ